MRLQQVAPGQGTSWVRKGFQVFGRQPLGFASLFAAGLFMSLLLGLIPLLGSIATLALAPAVKDKHTLAGFCQRGGIDNAGSAETHDNDVDFFWSASHSNPPAGVCVPCRER